ncbi:MAG: c-type cytochrome [Gemmatimonadota bacterium]
MNARNRCALLLSVGVLLGAGRAAAQTEMPAGVTQAAIDKGNDIFHKTGLCYACHGSEGKGLVGPNLTDDVWLHSKGSYEEIVAQVMKGVPKEESKSGVVMPPRGGSSISDDDVKAVAAYVWSLSHVKK